MMNQYGPDAISFYVSGQMSMEAQYLVNKLAKGFIRTQYIESNSRLCMASAGSGYKISLGADGPPGSYEDFDHADLFFVIGANMADCHPILFLRMMDRVKSGAKLIVVDPRRNETAEKADLYMPIKPGTDLALLNGLLHLLVKNGHTDATFIEQFTSGWEAMSDFLEQYTPGCVSEITGIAEEAIYQAARWIGESRNWMSCWTMGLNQSTHGTWHTNAICNLHLATGAICRTGSGPFSLTGQPNAMGGREMGYMGPGLPGQRSVLSEGDRAFIESLWKLPQGTIRTEAGSGTVSMFERMESGEIKACWIICTNPVASVPNRAKVIAGLQKAELVITQDVFVDTETNPYADIWLPGALWSEAEGVMVNSERNLTLLQKAVDPPGEVMPDWQIIALTACAMGYDDAFAYESAEEVYLEIQQAWNAQTGYDLRGASYEKLRQASVQWPAAPGSESSRNPIRYINSGVSQRGTEYSDCSRPQLAFATENGKAVFWARPYMAPAELPDEAFPFVLNTGRLQHQWHTMTKTGKIPLLNKLNPEPFIEIHPEDAAKLDIQEGQLVNIRSRRGSAVLPAVVTDKVMCGHAFAPIHWNDSFGQQLAVNAVTNDAVDPLSLQPEIKYCAVSLSLASKHPARERRTPGAEESSLSVPDESKELNRSKEGVHMAQLDALESLLGLSSSSVMTLERHEKTYIAGFLTSLRTEAQLTGVVPVLPPAAPLDPDKRYWLDGLLAGIFSRTSLPLQESAVSVLAPPEPLAADYGQAAASKQLAVTMVWASQTGNAESVAAECAQSLRASGFGVRLVNMNDYNPAELATEQYLLVAASTFGSGDPPDNGKSFWHALQAEGLPMLSQLRYAVLAFGDASYDQFCGFGRNLDKRLGQLGARRLISCTDCDADYEIQAQSWIQRMNTILLAEVEKEGANEAAAAVETELELRKEYDRIHPLHARLIRNRVMNKPGSEKETRHYIFDIKHSGLKYEAGDALGVWPINCPELIAEILACVQVSPDERVTLKDKGEMPVSEALRKHLEIARITTGMLQFVQKRSNSEELASLLKSDNKAELKQWLWGRQLADLLKQFPIKLSADELVSALKPLQPRFYSISSSPLAHPDEVHITVSTVRYALHGEPRMGVCSAYLADRAEAQGSVPIFVQKSASFKPPADPDVPMIMVGAGTGVGPFRGFLQERQAAGARGKNWLIFGEQREVTDFYFREEFDALKQAGVLHRLDTAFSRDQEHKCYVQHCMMEHGAELWAWLQEGAGFYVCGDASQMAKEADAALISIIQEHGGRSAEQAKDYVREMTKAKRYAKDVY